MIDEITSLKDCVQGFFDCIGGYQWNLAFFLSRGGTVHKLCHQNW